MILNALPVTEGLEDALALLRFMTWRDVELAHAILARMARHCSTRQNCALVVTRARRFALPNDQNPALQKWIKLSLAEVAGAETFQDIVKAWQRAPLLYEMGSPKYGAVAKAISIARHTEEFDLIVRKMILEGPVESQYRATLNLLLKDRKKMVSFVAVVA